MNGLAEFLTTHWLLVFAIKFPLTALGALFCIPKLLLELAAYLLESILDTDNKIKK